MAILWQAFGGVNRVILIKVALAGSDYKLGVGAVAEFANEKLGCAVRRILYIKEVAAYKHVVYSSAANVLHHTHKGGTESEPALITLLGNKSHIRRVEVNVAAMKEFELFHLIIFCHNNLPSGK